MFHKEFYPTPLEVLLMMDIDCNNKVCYEPHAGKGDVVDYLINNGAKKVIASEINEDLQKIVSSKCQLIGDDFFNIKPEDISHVQLIVMNPPFSNADKHIQHAFNIAPEGCEIISLCNWETVNKNHLYRRLEYLINDYGNSYNLGDVFTDAERTTGIDIGLVKLFKPIKTEQFNFEGFYLDEDDEEIGTNGIMPYNEVRALVNRYVGAMKIFDELKKQTESLNYSLKQIGISEVEINVGYKEKVTNKEDFSKYIQKQSWKYIFNKMNMRKYVTSKVMSDINKFVEQQQKIPFTMKNIYKMFEIIVGTRQETFNRALEEAIDNFTKYTHENRFQVEGWKTNSSYMINQKIIVNAVCSFGFNNTLRVNYDSYSTRYLNDLTKVLCSLTGRNYDDIKDINIHQQDNIPKLETNTWYDWGFFEFKVFKKGTGHFKFKNIEDWYILNQAYGKLKGFTLTYNYKK